MLVIYGVNKIRKFKKPVVALGIFDGLHLAHRRLLKDVVSKARRIKGTSTVVTFWPHPQQEYSIYSLRHRLRLISQIGIDVCIVIRFNRAFSRISAEDFIKDILVKKIGASYICVGKNFRFGRKAKGDFHALERLSGIYNFKLKVFDVVRVDNQPISSTYIRKLIMQGNLTRAKSLLSRPVSVLGIVVKGTSLGRSLGFPTANIDPHHEVLPPSGVYAVKVLIDSRKLRGVCYVGTKPTFKTHSAQRIAHSAQRIAHSAQRTTHNANHIEVYIFAFKRNIYGKDIEIQFIKKIREQIKFTSRACLVEQIKKDISLVKNLFSRHFLDHNR